MNKIKSLLKKVFFPFILIILILLIILFYFRSINYYQGSKEAAETINKYLKIVALEKVKTQGADLVIEYLNKPVEEKNFNNIVNPFKVLLKEIEEVEE